ncbi:MAG TPA: magnesium transporter CorA family protein [Humibacter sp.]|nr:magnesium transporter CorA family protein [Humibacter sp.]
MAHTRLYRNGILEREGFPAEEISDLIADPTATVWLDYETPSAADLAQIAEELSLHPLAVEDAVHEHQRPKLDRYDTHLFLAAYAIQAQQAEATGEHELRTMEVCAFITKQALVTVRKSSAFPLAAVLERWEAQSALAQYGAAYLLWGVLDAVVDSHFAAAQSLDDDVESLEDAVLAQNPDIGGVQRRSFRLRKDIMMLRRYALPMREVVGSLSRRDTEIISAELTPYFQDVYDHVLRVADWSESLRDLVGTILDTNLTNQSNRMNLVMKKVTSWAAIIAVPTLITGYFGQNLAFPLFGSAVGWWVSNGLIVACSLALYLQFKRRDWL